LHPNAQDHSPQYLFFFQTYLFTPLQTYYCQLSIRRRQAGANNKTVSPVQQHKPFGG